MRRAVGKITEETNDGLHRFRKKPSRDQQTIVQSRKYDHLVVYEVRQTKIVRRAQSKVIVSVAQIHLEEIVSMRELGRQVHKMVYLERSRLQRLVRALVVYEKVRRLAVFP